MADSHADDRVVSPVCSYRRKDTGDRCTGKLADGFAGCLAHLTTDQLDQALQRLHPGADLDASGTPINADLLAQILHAVRGDHERPTFGEVSFTHAHFTDSSARASSAGRGVHGPWQGRGWPLRRSRAGAPGSPANSPVRSGRGLAAATASRSAPHSSATAVSTCSQLSMTSRSCCRASTPVSESISAVPGA